MSTITPLPPARLRRDAEQLGAAFRDLKARAEQLAANISFGAHGLKRPGVGSDFWQYRGAEAGDPANVIDWRRSARGDALFIRQKEAELAQTLSLWVNPGRSMVYQSDDRVPMKIDRARLLALSLAIPMLKAGEKVGLAQEPDPAAAGRVQIDKLAERLFSEDAAEYAPLPVKPLPRGATLICISDFLGDWAETEAALQAYLGGGARGILVQVLDPSELSFPFSGRTIFESIGLTLSYESQRADKLKDRYRNALAAQQDHLHSFARKNGWPVLIHQTDQPALPALRWMATHAAEGQV